MFRFHILGSRIFREFLGDQSFPRPSIDISVDAWTKLSRLALGPETPVFDPYANDLNWLIASFVLPYAGLTAYVGANPLLVSSDSKAVSLRVMRDFLDCAVRQ